MEYRTLGRTGIKISVIGFGAIGARGVEAVQEMLEEGKRRYCLKLLKVKGFLKPLKHPGFE